MTQGPAARPSWVLKATCIAAIALGGVGILTGTVGVGGLLVSDQMSGANPFAPAGAVGERLQEIQAEMHREMQALAAAWRGVNLAILSAHLVVALGLVVGGIFAYRPKAGGHALLLAVFVTAMLLEAARIWPTVSIMQGNSEIMQAYMDILVPRAPHSATPVPEQVSSAIRTVSSASMLASQAFAVAGILLKLGFFAFGAIYLTRPQVRQLYAGPSSPPSH